MARRDLLTGRIPVAAAALCAAAATCAGASARGTGTPRIAVVVDAGGTQAVALLSPGGRVVARIPVARGIRAVAWRPSGGKLVVSTGGGNVSNELRVIDLARGTQHTLAGAKRASPAAFFGSVAWSPNGRWIAATRSPELYGAEIDVLDARSGRLIDAFHVAARADGGLSWSTDGADLYFARQSGGRVRPTLRRLVAATGRTVSLGVVGLDPQIDSDGVIAFTAPDGVRLLGQRKYRGSRAGDRLAAWTSDALLVERPAGAGCPREIHPVCSHVLRLVLDAAPRLLLRTPARNPAAR